MMNDKENKKRNIEGAYRRYKLGMTVIWFVFMMLLSNISLLFESVIFGNIVRTVVVIAAYAVFEKKCAKVEFVEANVTRQSLDVYRRNYRIGFKLSIPVFIVIVLIYIVEMINNNSSGAENNIAEYAALATSAAVCEELCFRAVPIRGMLLGETSKNTKNVETSSKKYALKLILITSAIFALFHLANILNEGLLFESNISTTELISAISQVVVAFGFGIAYAAIYYRSGTIIPAITLHFTNNMLAYLVGVGGSTVSVVAAILVGVYGIKILGSKKSKINDLSEY